MYSPTASALTLDDYIKKLQELAKVHGGNVKVLTSSGDYPEGANAPRYVHKGDGYTPSGTVVLS